MITYSNTDDMLTIASELKLYAKDLDDVFKKLNDRLKNVTISTGEWTGGQAERYFGNITEKTSHYSEQSEHIKNIAKELETVAIAINSITGEIEKQ